VKKFKFKLDALLKLREFNEYKIKMELGEIVKEMQLHRDRIKALNIDIGIGYDSLEKITETEVSVRVTQFYPIYIKSKWDEIKMREGKIEELGKEFEEVQKKLQVARGEVKVIASLKEEKSLEHKKENRKKEQIKIDEMVQVRKFSLENV
jgi:flagellar FliJ protein